MSRFLELLDALDGTDTNEIDKEIAGLEERMARLKQAKKLLGKLVATGGDQKAHDRLGGRLRVKLTDQKAQDRLDEKRRKVALFLKNRDGQGASKKKLADICGIAESGPQCLSVVLACDWFFVNPDSIVTLTDKVPKAVIA